MKTTVTIYNFRSAFEQCRPDNFTYEGLEVLFDYLEECEDSTGEEIELDVVGICCDYSEDTFKSIAENYSIDLSDCEDEDERLEAIKDYLNDNTIVCGETDNTIVYLQF